MKNGLVVKHNDLIEARYNLTLNEQRIILYSVNLLNRDKEDFEIVRIKINELTDLLDTTEKRYTEFRLIAENLISKTLTIKKDSSELVTSWLSSMEYLGNEGIIELEFSRKLIPYLLQLKEKFTRYELKNILNLRNKHSIRMYELMKQYEKIGQREINLDDLKSFLGITDEEYKRMYDFERFVLNISRYEINKYTDIHIDYEKIKSGRKISSILFAIKQKNTADTQYIKYLNENYNIAEIKTMSGLENEKLNSKQVMDLYEIAVNKTDDENVNPFEYIKLNYLLMIEKKTARNKFAYLKKALEDDYAVALVQLKFDIEI